MLRPTEFREIVSGRRRDLASRLLRAALRSAEIPYAAAMRARNRLYDAGLLRARHPGVPVVSVGNLTLGGTGKTPLVEWIARRLSARGLPLALLSRGYGAAPGRANDEALQLARRLPGVVHLADPDRVAAAARAIRDHHVRLILLDDAFQHRRIARDLDVVLLDALEPFGFDHVFPRGTLREPPAGLRRAQAIVLSRADAVSSEARAAIRRRVERLAPHALWAEACHAPRALVAPDGREQPCQGLEGLRVAAFCGLGNPAGFRHTLARAGAQVLGFREFPDHHPYTPADLEQLDRWAAALGAATLLCTEKDLVKLASQDAPHTPLAALRIELDFLAGRPDLERRLDALAP